MNSARITFKGPYKAPVAYSWAWSCSLDKGTTGDPSLSSLLLLSLSRMALALSTGLSFVPLEVTEEGGLAGIGAVGGMRDPIDALDAPDLLG